MTDEGASPQSRRLFRQNFALGVANGAIFAVVEALRDPTLVLSVFVSRLSGSDVLVGLLIPMSVGGWYLPQLLLSCAVGATAPLLALASAAWAGPLRAGPTLAPLLVFAGVFASLGAARTGVYIGGTNYLLDIAPSGDRAIYIDLTNTLVGVVSLATALGGVIAEAVGYEALFLLALLLFTLAYVSITTAEEPRARTDRREVASP